MNQMGSFCLRGASLGVGLTFKHENNHDSQDASLEAAGVNW